MNEAQWFVGIRIEDTPFISWENGQGKIADQLRAAGAKCAAKYNAGPNLIVVILPEGGNDIYTAVKQYVHYMYGNENSPIQYLAVALVMSR